MGCDDTNSQDVQNQIWFQSTHPHGVRLAAGAISKGRGKFQSTHPHGVRPVFSPHVMAADLFQSTHPHGVRL